MNRARGLLALAAAGVGLPILYGFRQAAREQAGPQAGLPLDDAWIHLRFAETLISGGGWGFNPGEPSAGSTSPLWILLLAAGRLAGVGPPELARMLSAAAFIATAALAGWVTLEMLRPVEARWRTAGAVAVTLLVPLAGRFAWSGLSGMEVTLFAALTLGAALAWMRCAAEGSAWLAALLTGLAAVVRPEGLLFALLAVGVRLRTRLRLSPAEGLALAVPVLPWLLFCLAQSGRPLPATFTPNGGGLTWPDAGYLLATLRLLRNDGALLLPLAALGAGVLIFRAAGESGTRGTHARAALLLPLWVFALPLASSMVAPNLRHHGRYNMPLLPPLICLAVTGVVLLAAGRQTSAPPGRRLFRALLVALPVAALLFGMLWSLPRWAETHGRDVAGIDAQHVRVAGWLAERAGSGCRVATHDIGAIGLLSGCHVTDLVGLVTPEVARLYIQVPDAARRDPLIREFLARRAITHVVIYPGWFPALARDPSLGRVYQAASAGPSVAGGRRLAVYAVRPSGW